MEVAELTCEPSRPRQPEMSLRPQGESDFISAQHRAGPPELRARQRQQQEESFGHQKACERPGTPASNGSRSPCMNRNFKPQIISPPLPLASKDKASPKAAAAQQPPMQPMIIRGNRMPRGTFHRAISSNHSIPLLCTIPLVMTLICSSRLRPASAGVIGGGGAVSGSGERMVRLCIASVDPIKLSSQCVMCNRREFPLTVIDCTGITKVNDLIANPLSVQEATCLIYNCRRQVPDVKPELYHGSVSSAVNYRGGLGSGAATAAASNYQQLGGPPPLSPASGPLGHGAGSSLYEMMTPSGLFGGGYAMQPSSLAHPEQQRQQQLLASASPYMARLGMLGYGASSYQAAPASSIMSPLASFAPRGMIGGPSLFPNRQQQALPYALVPAPFGSRKYKAALVPLFK